MPRFDSNENKRVVGIMLTRHLLTLLAVVCSNSAWAMSTQEFTRWEDGQEYNQKEYPKVKEGHSQSYIGTIQPKLKGGTTVDWTPDIYDEGELLPNQKTCNPPCVITSTGAVVSLDEFVKSGKFCAWRGFHLWEDHVPIGEDKIYQCSICKKQIISEKEEWEH